MSAEVGEPPVAPVHVGPARSPSATSHIVCRQVASWAERAQHFAIRHRIFVEEQAVFDESDVDAHDRDATVIALIGYCDGEAAGTVRLFALDLADGVWQGDRLAVLAAYRLQGVGAPLVRCAVATAGALGGRLMRAHIQPPNVRFFGRLGWEPDGPLETYAGRPHHPMRIELPAPDQARSTLRRLAAGVSARDL